jgi:dynactin-5
MASAFSSATIVSSREWTTTDSGCRLHRSVHAPGIQNIVLQGKTIISAGCVIRGDLQKVVPGRGSSAGGLVVGQGAVVGIGKYGFVGERTIIRPSTTLRDGWVSSRVQVRPSRMLTLRGLPPPSICTTLPFKIGEYVHIGSDCIIQAASIGIWVVIGDGCVVVGFCDRPSSSRAIYNAADHPRPHFPHADLDRRGQGNYSVIKDGVQLDPGTVVPPGTNLPAMTRWAGNPGERPKSCPCQTSLFVC